MQSSTQQKATAQEAGNNRPVVYILKFLLVWFSSLFFIGIISLLSDVNWIRPYVERQLNSALDRRVRLGKLTWNLGLNGLAVESSSLKVEELDGKPFLTAARGEIGLSVMALLSRKLVFTYIEADKADVRFVKLGENHWNFDDLVRPGPEVRLLQLTDSRFGVFDATKSLKPMQLEKVELKLNFPRKNQPRPFFFSSSLPGKGYTTTLTVDGLGVGELEHWTDNKYSFKVLAKNVNPRDVEGIASFVAVKPKAKSDKTPPKSLVDTMKPLEGLFDIEVNGGGTFDKSITANIETSSKNLSIVDPALGDFNAGKTEGSLSANLNKDAISWSDLVFNLRGLEVRSTGMLSQWQKDEPAIKAAVEGNVTDLGLLQDMLKPKQGQSASGNQSMSGLAASLAPTRLSGQARIEIKVDGTTSNTKLATTVKTRDLAVKEMLDKANERFPILCTVGISDKANIESQLEIDSQGRIEIVDGRIKGPGTNLQASGWIDLKENKSKLVIKGDKIALSNAAIGIASNEKVFKQVAGHVRLPGKNSFSLDGVASATATLTTVKDDYKLDGQVHLNNASFALKDNSLKLGSVSGTVKIEQNNHGGHLDFVGIKGDMGDGDFQMDGKLTTSRAALVDVTLHATSFDLKHLSSLVKLFQIDMPVIAERQLYGRVKDVVLKVTGTTTQPKIFFSAVPDDLYYQPPGLARPLRAKAGTIVYDNDQLVLREVAIISNGKTITTSMTIDKVSKECLLSRVKTKSDSIELADLHYYLSSTAMPPPLRKAYLDFLNQYKIVGLHGKAYGDILCLINAKGDAVFDGLIGCYKVGATIAGYPLTRLEGIFAASGDELLLQDLSGYIRGSKFSLDGFINKYRSKSPNWRTEISTTLAPRELIELIPHLTEEVKATRVQVRSKGALTVRAKVEGNFQRNKIQYSLVADQNDKMIIECPFGKLYQPDAPLTVEGTVTLDKHKIELGETHVLVGESLISLDGEVMLPEPPPKGARANPPGLSLNVKLPQKSPIKTLISIVDPPLAKDFSGTIFGQVTVNGDMKNPQLLTDVTLIDIDAPLLNISGLNGRVRSSMTESSSDDEVVTTTLTQKSVIEIDSVKLRKLPITNLRATIALEPARDEESGPVVVIDKGRAQLADGTVKLQARFQPGNNKIWTKVELSDISAARISDELLDMPQEITGTAHAQLEIRTNGDDYHQLLKNLKGQGEITIEEGIVTRFSDLQTRLAQYNLLTQGIFGFNFNNLLQSMWPVRSGQFHILENSFSLDKGLLKVEELRFSGNDMRIWGKGVANLEDNKIKLELAGKIPRVQGSVLGGSLGSVSRSITLQKLMKVATFGKLESLPSLPVLGAIATDKPRTFTFNVDTKLDNPRQIAKAIEKSFKWLPNKPEATAHPVPGLEM